MDLPSFIKKPIWGQREQQDSSMKINKEKLSSRKLREAIEDYDIWFRQFKILRRKQTHLNPIFLLTLTSIATGYLQKTRPIKKEMQK